MRLKEHDKAPVFLTKDILGNEQSPAQFRGAYLLLSFYRYASCPLCNMRMHSLISRYDELRSRNLNLLAVFQSPEKSIQRYVGRQNAPFSIIADPDMELYKLYGVESSWPGFLKGCLRIGTFFKAFSKGFWLGKMESSIARIPADFVIGPDGRILRAYYGRDMGDHLPLKDILETIAGRGI